MVMKFKTDNKKSILCCIVDNLDLYQSGWAREVSINLTDFMIHRFSLKNFDIYIDKNENLLLEEASNGNYTHAIIIACGTSFNLSDRIFNAIEELCKKDFFVAGHILDRHNHPFFGNACFELHHQFYVVNLADYRLLGCPIVGQQENTTYTQLAPKRSKEFLYNDEEVPVWIEPGDTEHTYDIKLHGWNILNQGWLHNRPMIDLGEDIRTSKRYVYYEYDYVFLREVSALYYNQFFCHNMFAPFNSDELQKGIPFEGPVEQYVTVGIGLNWIKNIIQVGYTSDTKVIFTDINFNCLKFMKAMIETWDGKDYVAFYQDFVSIQPNNSSFNPLHHNDSYYKEWNAFTESFDNWPSMWDEMKKLTYDFILIDYTSSYNFNWLATGKKTLMNLSDLFNHVPFIMTQPLKYRITCENRLFEALKNHDPNITLLLTSRATDGFCQTLDRHLIDRVENFELTDLNILKRPPWHITDWDVICLVKGTPKILR
jgi:hypothetical protein